MPAVKRKKPDSGSLTRATPFWQDSVCQPLLAMLPEPAPLGEHRQAMAVCGAPCRFVPPPIEIDQPNPNPKKKKAKGSANEEENGSTKKEEQEFKAQKWMIKPTAEQRSVLRTWFHAVRMVYNKCVEHANKTNQTDLGSLRNAAGTEDARWQAEAPAWMRGVPYEVRDSAVRDMNKAAAAQRAKARKRVDKGSKQGREQRQSSAIAGPSGKKIHFKYRRKKNLTESITLRKRQLNCKSARGEVWPALFGTIEDRSVMQTERGKSLPAEFPCDARLLYNRAIDRFYLCMPQPIVYKHQSIAGQAAVGQVPGANTQAPEIQGRVCAVDPGVRVFATAYCPNPGPCITASTSCAIDSKTPINQASCFSEWGASVGEKIKKLRDRANEIDRKASQKHGQRRRRTRRVAARLRERGRNLADELHRKLARWLFGNHGTVLLPDFRVRGMAAREGRCLDADGRKKRATQRRINRTTTGRMYGLSHFRFRQFATHKAKEMGCRLIICDEAFTSKTCGRCGRENKQLGASKEFRCAACGYAVDRDHNAARNILLRYAVQHPGVLYP